MSLHHMKGIFFVTFHVRHKRSRLKLRPRQESGVYTFMNLLPLTSIIKGGGLKGQSPFTVLMIFLYCNGCLQRLVGKRNVGRAL